MCKLDKLFNQFSACICTANQLTGFYMRATLALNGLNQLSLILSSVFENQVNFCSQGRMPFLNMSDASLEF